MPQVEIRGNADLRKALQRFTPDLEKALRKELHTALMPVVAQARAYVEADSPMSRWAPRSFSEARFPFYSASRIQSGITLTTKPGKSNRNGFRGMAQIHNKSAAGAIYEVAGRVNPQGQVWVGPKAGGASKGVSRSSNPGAGATFISNLPPLVSSLKGQGRLIFRAWAHNQGRAEGAAGRAIDKATKQFYLRTENQLLRKAA